MGDHMTANYREALRLLARGEPLPVDLQFSLLDEGVCPEDLADLAVDLATKNLEETLRRVCPECCPEDLDELTADIAAERETL